MTLCLGNNFGYTEKKREGKSHPSGFDEALSNAIEERVAKVEEATLFKARKLVKQRSVLHVACHACPARSCKCCSLHAVF